MKQEDIEKKLQGIDLSAKSQASVFQVKTCVRKILTISQSERIAEQCEYILSCLEELTFDIQSFENLFCQNLRKLKSDKTLDIEIT